MYCENSSISVTKPELEYKIVMQVQTKEEIRLALWGKKDVLAVSVAIEENGKHVVFCCGKATSVRWWGVGVRWAVDLRGDGRAERWGCVGRVLAMKRRLGKEEGVVDDEKMPLLE
jgi:hypothetical protein